MSVLNIHVQTKSFSTALADAERVIYRDAYREVRYNQLQAAKLLGVSRGTFRTKMKHYFGDEYIGSRSK